MPHHHGLSHVVRRQDSARDRHDKHEHVNLHQKQKEQENNEENRDEDENEDVATVVSVVFKTMPKTFSGDAVFVTQAPATLIGVPVQVSTAKNTQSSSKPKASAHSDEKPSATSRKPSKVESEAEETSKPTSAPAVASTLMVATSSPIVTGAIAATASSSSTPTAEASKSSGLSGGAKAGLALGVLLAIAGVLAAILILYHRKKKKTAQQKMDDEKTAMQNVAPPPPVEVASSIRTARTMSTAPRLSLRPVTQFSPTLNENRKSGGNMLGVAAAAAPREQTPSPTQPNSSWERPGAANAAGTPTDPFGDPQTTPQNPFGNHAATETPQTTIPSTLSANHPPAPDSHLNDFANPAPAPTLAAVAVPVVGKEVPSPPSIRSENGTVPPSPAWTEDIPASPGPAPTGPPPIAVAGGNANGPAPAPAGPNNVHRVQLDFKPSMNDELELHAGQLVRMLHEYDDGWALCVRMDRSQQGVVPRTCLSKHPMKPRTGPPRQSPPGAAVPRMRGPPVGPHMGPGAPQPRPLSPASGRSSPHPPSLSPANGRMSPGPRSMSPGPRSMSPSPNMGGRGRSNSNAPYAGPPRSMSPGPYGGGPQQMPPPQMQRPRSNSASQVMARRASPPGPSPMNPNANLPMPARKPLPGQAM